MLKVLVGEVDLNAAIVLAVMFIAICIVVTSLIAKRRSKQEVHNEFELAKMKQQADDRARLYGLDTERQYKFKQLDKNLITSHREEKGGQSA